MLNSRTLTRILFPCSRWASDNRFTGKLPEFLGTFADLKDLYAYTFFVQFPF